MATTTTVDTQLMIAKEQQTRQPRRGAARRDATRRDGTTANESENEKERTQTARASKETTDEQDKKGRNETTNAGKEKTKTSRKKNTAHEQKRPSRAQNTPRNASKARLFRPANTHAGCRPVRTTLLPSTRLRTLPPPPGQFAASQYPTKETTMTTLSQC